MITTLSSLISLFDAFVLLHIPYISLHGHQVKDKLYQAAHWVSTHSLPPGESNESPAHEASRISDGGGEKKGKKEVSFSLDEDEKEAEGDPDTSGSLGSVFSSPTSAAPDNNNLVSGASG